MKKNIKKRMIIILIEVFIIVTGVVVWYVVTKDKDKVREVDNNSTSINQELEIKNQIKFDIDEAKIKKVTEEEFELYDDIKKEILARNKNYFFPYGHMNGPYSNKEQLFTDVEIPEDFQLAYYQQAYEAIMEWNHGWFVGNFELAVSNGNSAYFTFGYGGYSDNSKKFTAKNKIIGSSLDFPGYIMLLTQDNNGQIYLEVFDTLLNSIAYCLITNIDEIDTGEPVYIVPKGEMSFYILYTKEQTQYCALYQMSRIKNELDDQANQTAIQLDYVDTFRFKENIQQVYIQNNIIGLEYTSKESQEVKYIAIMNRQLELLDVLQLPANIGYSDLTMWSSSGELTYAIRSEVDNKEVIYRFRPKSNIEGMHYYNALNSLGVFIDGEFINQDFNHNITSNLSGVTYYRLSDGDIIKITNRDSIIIKDSSFDEIASELTKVYRWNDLILYFGEERILSVKSENGKDKEYEKLVGLSVYKNYLYDSYEESSLLYIDMDSKVIGKILKNGTLEVLADLSDSIYSTLIEDGYSTYTSVYEYQQGVAVSTNYSGVFNYYSKATKKWTQYNTESSASFDDDLKTYTYGYPANYIFDPMEEHFEIGYPYYRQPYDKLYWDDVLYINIDLEVMFDVDREFYEKNPMIKSVHDEYVTIHDIRGQDELRIINSDQINDRRFVQLHDLQSIVEVTDDYVIPIIDIAVRSYDINEKGILYTGYGDEANTYFYSFETKKSILLYDKFVCNELSLVDSKAVIITNFEEVRSLDLDQYTADSEAVNITQLVNNDSANNTTTTSNTSTLKYEEYDLLTLGDKCLISFVDRSLFAIFDPLEKTIIDHFEGSRPYIYNDKLIYSAKCLLASYDLESKTVELLLFTFLPSVIRVVEDKLYYYAGVYDIHFYGDLQVNTNYFEGKEEKDYYIFEFDNSSYYSSTIMLYDKNAKRLKVFDKLVELNYKLLPTSLKYKGNPTNGVDSSEVWLEYPLNEGYSFEVNTIVMP